MSDDLSTMGPIDGATDRHFGIMPLRCQVQHYAWGGLEDIPRLLGVANDDGRPFAELWIGAHPDLPSLALVDGAEHPLNELIAAEGQSLLGSDVATRFDRSLPFLLKVLSARLPLSIQAHPNSEQARAGFAREEAAGVAPSDPRRNYRDRNHKPELLCALTDFYALRGFRPIQEIAQILSGIPELGDLTRHFASDESSLVELYSSLMRMEQGQVDALLVPLLDRLRTERRGQAFTREHWEFWALRADEVFADGTHKDRGIFSIFLLNLLHLRPGTAIYLPAGELHAYLEGTGVEVMANSNNVLRGGLTSKHVDVDELLSVLRFDCALPELLVADPATQIQRYSTPAEEFELVRLNLSGGEARRIAGGAISLGVVTEGRAIAHEQAGGPAILLDRGAAFLVPHGVGYGLRAQDRTEIYLARVPQALSRV